MDAKDPGKESGKDPTKDIGKESVSSYLTSPKEFYSGEETSIPGKGTKKDDDMGLEKKDTFQKATFSKLLDGGRSEDKIIK